MSFSPGASFYDDTPGTATQATATADSLHALITSAALAGVTAGEHDSEYYLIFSKPTRPTSVEDQANRTMWFDETDLKLKQRALPGDSGLGKYHDFQTEFDGSNGPEDHHIPKGSVLIGTGQHEFSECATASYAHVSGIAAATLDSNGDHAKVVKLGMYEVLIDGPILPGDLLISSGVTGYARSGTFENAMNYTMDLTIGQALYSLGTVTALVTCLVTL